MGGGLTHLIFVPSVVRPCLYCSHVGVEQHAPAGLALPCFGLHQEGLALIPWSIPWSGTWSMQLMPMLCHESVQVQCTCSGPEPCSG